MESREAEKACWAKEDRAGSQPSLRGWVPPGRGGTVALGKAATGEGQPPKETREAPGREGDLWVLSRGA